MLLQIFFETNHFISPENKCVLSLCIWKFHKVSFFKLSHVLVHFFLSVTGSLPDNYIREIKERTFICSRKSVTGLDQRTEVLRQFLFCFCDGLIRSRTKAYTCSSHCHSKLLRKVCTIRSYYRHPFIFQFFYCKKGIFTLLCEFFKHFRQIFNNFHVISS